jgi:hypothetical protein
MGKRRSRSHENEITVRSLPLRRRDGARMGFGKREEGIVLHLGLVVGFCSFFATKNKQQEARCITVIVT